MERKSDRNALKCGECRMRAVRLSRFRRVSFSLLAPPASKEAAADDFLRAMERGLGFAGPEAEEEGAGAEGLVWEEVRERLLPAAFFLAAAYFS